MLSGRRLLLACVVLWWTPNCSADSTGPVKPLIHTVITTQCNLYQDWQVLGLYWTWQRVGSPGLFTRIAACSAAQLLNRAAFDPCPVYYTEDTPDPEHTGDSYSPFNKPWGLKQWLENAQPQGDYFLLLDADMTFHRSFSVEEFGVRPGWGAAQNMWYMADLNKFMAQRMMPPDTPVYDDWLAAPFTARRADEVGEFFLYHEADIKRLSPLYWDYSLKARTFHERHAAELPPGTPAERPWVAEMYGGAMAAAAAGVRHYGQNATVWHPPAHPANDGVPWLVSHYAWNAEVPGTHLKWNKHTYRGFTALKCPPWHLDQLQTVEAWSTTYNISGGGMFDHPPRPSRLTSTGRDLLRDLANIEMIALPNEAFCELHHRHRCPPSDELKHECGMAEQIVSELVDRYLELEELSDNNIYCMDDSIEECHAKLRPVGGGKAEWSCAGDPAISRCRQSCSLCPPKHPALESTWYRMELRARQARMAERKAIAQEEQAASDLAAQEEAVTALVDNLDAAQQQMLHAKGSPSSPSSPVTLGAAAGEKVATAVDSAVAGVETVATAVKGALPEAGLTGEVVDASADAHGVPGGRKQGPQDPNTQQTDTGQQREDSVSSGTGSWLGHFAHPACLLILAASGGLCGYGMLLVRRSNGRRVRGVTKSIPR